MRHYFRYFALLVVCLCAAGLSAQSWTASAPGEGTFYLYNVGNAGFLYGANDWGTRASLTKETPMSVTLSAGSDGGYYISTSPVYNGRYLGSDGYVDKESSSSKYTTWIFEPVSGQENVYLMKAGNSSGNYLYGHASDVTKTSTGTTAPSDSKGYWKLVSREAWIAAMANATMDSPMDVTFLVQDAFFGKGTDYNTVWNGSVALGGPDNNNCAERYEKSSFEIYQTITGVPNGIYKMSVQGFYRYGDGAAAASAREASESGVEPLLAKYYINATEAPLMSIFDDNITLTNNSTYNTSSAVSVNGTNYYLPNNMDRAAACFGMGCYVNERIQAVVTDGTVRIGLKKTEAKGADWAIFDNVKLYYYGIDLSSLSESYETLLATAKGLQNAPMQASVKTALNAAVTAAETNPNTSNQEWLEAQISTLNTAVANARASKALYEGEILTAVNILKAQSACESVKTTLQTKYDNGEYATASEVYSIYRPLEIAALGTAANTVYTSVIFNRDFEQGQYSWSGSPGVNGTDENKCAEKWNETFDVYQTITGLPNGYYTMSLQGFYRVGNGTNDASAAAAAREAGNEALYANYYINDGSGHLMSIFDSGLTQTNNSTYNTSVAVTINGTNYYVPNTQARAAACFTHGDYVNTPIQGMVTDGTLRIGVRKSTGNGSDWAAWDNITLTYVGPYTPANYTDVVINANIENNEVSAYLNDNTYTESSATAIDNYNINAASRNDQPASINIFLPAQTADATLYVSHASDYSDAVTYTVTAGTDLYQVANLLPQQTYYYKVVGDGNAIVTNGTINTTGHLRMIKADGISNMRDLGGWETADGNRVKYGKIFRGTELAGGKSYTASTADLAMLKNNLNIAAEVDLREDADFANGLMSASAIDGATYYYANLNSWAEGALYNRTEDFKAGFNLVYDAVTADKAAYFHCIYGADRTGCFAMLLEGLLGLPVDQLYKDYELTSFSSAGKRSKDGIDSKLNYIKLMPGTTLQEKFFNYWRYAVGIDKTKLLGFIDAMVEGSNPKAITSIADYTCTPAIADGEYYIYLPDQQKFLGRGQNYGTRAVTDNYGIPAAFATNAVGLTTIKFLDSNLYFGSDGFTDKAVTYESIVWILETSGENYVLHSANGKYMQMTADANPRARVDAESASATPINVKTLAEQNAIVAATHLVSAKAALADAGLDITAVNSMADVPTALTSFTEQPSSATIKSATSGNTTDWPITQHSDVQDGWSVYNTGDYGSEVYQKNGVIQQTVTVPHPGIYKLTLNAFFRQGGNSICYAVGEKGYELSNAFVSVNDTYFAQIPSWYSDCASSTNPNNTDEAKALMDAGKYAMEVYAYVGDSKQLTISVNVPGYVSECWCLFNNFKLTEYCSRVVISDADTEAPTPCESANVYLTRKLVGGQWNGFSLPFSLTQEQLEASPLNGASIMEYESAEGNEMKLAYTHEIVAGEPYLIKPESTIENPVFKGVTVTNPEEVVKGDGDYKLAAHLYYTGLPTDGSVAYVSTNDSSIKKLTSGGIKGLRSYFQIPTESSAKALIIQFEETDGIVEMDNGQWTMDNGQGDVYNLAGQRLQKPQRGVNIIRSTQSGASHLKNGKKVIVK